MKKAPFIVVQFLKDFFHHKEGDRTSFRDWYAEHLKKQGIVKFIGTKEE